MLQFVLKKQLPFAIWSLPGESKWQGIAQDDYEVDTLNLKAVAHAKGFIVAPFDSKNIVNLIRADIEFDSENFSLEIGSELVDRDFEINKTSDNFFIINRDSYFELCGNLIKNIHNGKAEKVVLSRVIEILFDKNKLIRFFTKLLEEHRNAMVYLYSTGNGIWIGASPEILTETKNNRFKIMALAGSKAVKEDDAWGNKEYKEQQYVTHYIQQILNTSGILFKKSELKTIIAGPVAHLQTIFTGDIADNELSKIIEQLHPTPAVCGIPKEKALDLIRVFEKHQRGDYTGYIGPVDQGDVNLFVNLRSAKISNNKMHLFIGGGITADSVPEKEWEETVLKAKTLLDCYKNC